MISVNRRSSKFKTVFHVENPEHQKPMALSQLWYSTMTAIQSPGPSTSQFFLYACQPHEDPSPSFINNFGTPASRTKSGCLAAIPWSVKILKS